MPAPHKFTIGRDRNLQARMVFTMLLLVVVYGAFVAFMVASGGYAIAVLTVVTVVAVVQLALSTRLALSSVDGREVTPAEEPELHAIVDRLCIQADLRKPAIAVGETDLPNAFAIGLSPGRAQVCVTRGLQRRLSPAELEAVVAHELAHVANRDVLVMTIASFVAVVALYMTKLVHISVRLFFAFAAIGLATYALGRLLLLAVSRHREFAADRTAALMTGRPSALASALVKVADGIATTPTTDLRAARQLTAFFVVSAEEDGLLRRMLATHPRLRDRVEALGQIEQSLHGASFDPDVLLAAERVDSGPRQQVPAQAAPQMAALAAAPPASATTPAGWYADPWRAARLRWYDGRAWTGHTSA